MRAFNEKTAAPAKQISKQTSSKNTEDCVFWRSRGSQSAIKSGRVISFSLHVLWNPLANLAPFNDARIGRGFLCPSCVYIAFQLCEKDALKDLFRVSFSVASTLVSPTVAFRAERAANNLLALIQTRWLPANNAVVNTPNPLPSEELPMNFFPAGTTQTAKLTKREVEVLSYIGDGETSKEVAKRLFVSKRTVDFHLANMYTKLGVTNRVQALKVAAARGLLPAAVS